MTELQQDLAVLCPNKFAVMVPFKGFNGSEQNSGLLCEAFINKQS
jgi:hypothetical protein